MMVNVMSMIMVMGMLPMIIITVIVIKEWF